MDLFIVRIHNYCDCDAYEHFRDCPDTIKMFLNEDYAKKYCDDYVHELRKNMKEHERQEREWLDLRNKRDREARGNKKESDDDESTDTENSDDEDSDEGYGEYRINCLEPLESVKFEVKDDGSIDISPTSYKDEDKYCYAWVEDGTSMDIYKITIPIGKN